MHPRLLLLALACASSATAQQLALQTFSVRDGLAHSRVNCLFEDCRGYLWLGTWEGLSRFDGRSFVNFGTADGLPNPFVTSIAEDHEGALWVGTLGNGIARLRERRDELGRAFEAWAVGVPQLANDVSQLLVDGAGRLWITTAAGVYRGEVQNGAFAGTCALASLRHDLTAVRDGAGEPLFLGSGTVAARRGDALVPTAWQPPAGFGNAVAALPYDGGFLIAGEHGLAHLLPPFADPPTVFVAPLHPDERVTALAHDRRGSLWVATSAGLLERNGTRWQRFDVRHGLPDDLVRCLFVDRDDGLWIGTHRGGVACLRDRQAVTFAARQGFTDVNVARVVPASGGRLLATTGTGGQYLVLPDRVERLPQPAGAGFATAHRRVHCDRRGDFWIGTEQGLWHCPGPDLDPARCHHLDVAHGLPAARVCSELHESADGRLWLCTLDCDVFVRERDGTSWQRFVSMGDLGDLSACRLVVDWRGDIALASFDHLWRRAGGTWQRLQFGVDGPLRPRSVRRDRDGWMWVGTRFLGVFAELPSGDVLHLDVRDGLASDAVWAIAEDGRGNLYFGTARGITRYDKASGRLHPFAGELLREPVNDLHCAAGELLWAATMQGLLRFDLTTPTPARTPPQVYVAAVAIDGEQLPLPIHGVSAAADVVLSAGQRSLEVEFVGVGLGHDGPLRFQHRLLGVDAGWSPPSDVPRLRFANLAAGDYCVRVRAVAAGGLPSAAAAELSFTVLPAFWQRAWFGAATLGALATVAFAFHRLRLRRAVATERLRTQIATDLHDDIGAGLAQIAILSEVAKRNAAEGRTADLGEIAQLARTLRAAMGDIVWALARTHDSLADLTQRMRQLSTRMLELDRVELAFTAPPAVQLEAVRLSPEQRRQLWLWFREALTNVARHARAKRVDLLLALDAGSLRLSVRDDGIGFAPESTPPGNGLPSLAHRCAQLGARLQLDSAPGAGTTVTLVMPLRRPRAHGS